MSAGSSVNVPPSAPLEDNESLSTPPLPDEDKVEDKGEDKGDDKVDVVPVEVSEDSEVKERETTFMCLRMICPLHMSCVFMISIVF